MNVADEAAPHRGARQEVELEPSQADLVPALARWLTRVGGLTVHRRSEPGSAAELGAADVIVAVVSSSGLVALINMIPEFVRSRREHVRVKVRAGKREVEIEADNVTDAAEIIARLFPE